MSTYIIDFSDPLKGGFSIAPGGFNGPGGALSATSLRLYGRGALEWGEAVNEDMVRLSENFAGATAPTAPVGGQLWIRQKLYVRNTSVALPAPAPNNSLPAADGAFYRYKFGLDAYGNPVLDGNQWYSAASLAPNTFAVTVFNGTISAYGSGTTLGEYVYAMTDGKLYRWDTAYKQAAPAWLERSVRTMSTTPNAPLVQPDQALVTWDEFSQEWVSPQIVAVTSGTTPSTDPKPGELWYNTVATGPYIPGVSYGVGLHVFDGTNWIPVVMAGNIPNTSILNMGGFRIVNLGTPVASTDAATKGYVDTAVSLSGLQAILDPVYVNVNGDTMTGYLTLVGAPVNANHAATKAYTDGAISTAISALGLSGGGAAASVFTGGSPTYKAGDIYTNGVQIWIAVGPGVGAPPSGNWRQVFPAQYS